MDADSAASVWSTSQGNAILPLIPTDVSAWDRLRTISDHMYMEFVRSLGMAQASVHENTCRPAYLQSGLATF